ncbi:hypothetical protein SLA2020_471450 [Shorea laevis]
MRNEKSKFGAWEGRRSKVWLRSEIENCMETGRSRLPWLKKLLQLFCFPVGAFHGLGYGGPKKSNPKSNELRFCSPDYVKLTNAL